MIKKLKKQRIKKRKPEKIQRQRLKKEQEKERADRERLEQQRQTRLEEERKLKLQKEEQERERLQRERLRKEQEEKETEGKLQRRIELAINTRIEKGELYRFISICLDTPKHNNLVNHAQTKDDHVLYNKHRNILNQWNINSNKLGNFKLQTDDDEKKENDSEEFGVDLFNKYTECLSIINEQTNRLNQVTTDQYLLELINRQTALSKSAKEYEQESVSGSAEYNNKKKQYESVKQQRIELQREINALFRKCNEAIKSENTLYQQLQKSVVKKETMDKRIENLKASSKSCVSVIKSYNDFMENNKKYIDKINDEFKKKWEEFESKWMEWNVKDIIVWFKYRTIQMDTKKINWMNVENQLKNRNITGKSLENFNNLVFELIGIQDFNIVTHLGSQIAILKKKYNVNNNDKQNVNNNDGTKEIPEEYLCPITKRIMQDPVMAFDGYTYERNAIESYFKINNKSPVTGADADYVIVFPNHKLKAVIHEYIKENKIDIEQQNEGCQEGVAETSFIE